MSDLGKASVNLMDTLVLERETNGQSPEYSDWGAMMIRRALMAERTRCLNIIQSIETTSAQGKRVIDEIVRKVRGQE